MSLFSRTEPIICYTDGSCLTKKRLSCGGWAAILIMGKQIFELSGHVVNTTNQRMELLAAIEALQSISTFSNVYVHTDSKYLQNGIMYWLQGWKKRDWKTVHGAPVANRDLWELLDQQNERHMVSWHWVRGHSEDEYNIRCDQLAQEEAKKLYDCYIGN